MQQNETPRPIYIGLLGADAVMLRAQVDVHALQQFGLVRGIGVGVWGEAGIRKNLGLRKWLTIGASLWME